MANENNNDVIIINLDRPRVIRFGHLALKKLSAMTGLTIEQLASNDTDLEQLETIIYCGIFADALENGEELKLEQMELLLDKAPNPKHYMDKMAEALSYAYGTNQVQSEGNAQAGKPTQNRASRRKK
ncbi:hypothetical protein PAECIP111891_06719 [Paenibacillus allorhizoplanae]|uniref:Phage tail assembly protein n=1 Tax=Paenibacillus allorhizoplanae TaxID=2905648 RepID=A0ABM9CYB8_9BACL|nr:hypothetical protein [Paenibacillus allorhizoplanae]CAH1230677.1 hypothetical protein PAECIP111891_06719 [Paenibacillus allorhizoplanae]